MLVPRKDPFLNEIIEILENHFKRCKWDIAQAWNTLTKDEIEFIGEELDHCDRDPRYYLENYYVVKSKLHGIKTLYPLWDSQEIFYADLMDLVKVGKPCKVIVLKARQLGLSTISEGLIFHRTVFTEATNSLIVAQDPSQADYLFSMFTNAYEYLPWWMRPEVRYRSKGRYMVFDADTPEREGLKSEIFVEAANKMTGVSVGKAIQAAHCSELSDWDDAKTLTQQIFPTFSPNVFAVLESTARGRQGFWYDFWRDSVNKWGDGSWDWKPIFIEWFRCTVQYSKPIENKEAFKLTEDEQTFRQKVVKELDFFIPDEMFNWKRSKIDETIAIDGDEYSFYQEYPSNWMEAFQASGLCAFPKRKLQQIMERNCCMPRWVGELEYRHGAAQEIHLRSIEDPTGLWAVPDKAKIPGTDQIGYRFRVWEKPEPGESYYVAADPSMGIEGGDYACAQVIRIGTGGHPDEQVAEWHGWVNPTPFGHIIVGIAKWYNMAELALELNSGVGEKTYMEVFRILEYINLFRWKHYDKIKNFYTDYMGWYTNVKTRDLIITGMRERIMENTVVLRSYELLDEMSDFSQDDDGGRFEGQNTNDDRVMAAMIAVWCAHDSDYGKQAAVGNGQGNVGRPKYYVFDEKGKKIQECDDRNQAWAIASQKSGWSFQRQLMAKDFSNSDFSPVHDRVGPRSRLFESGIPAERITAAGLHDEESSSAQGDWRDW